MDKNNKGKCIIIVPVYKEHLSSDEAASLIQLRKVLGGKHDVSLVCPKSLNVAEYLNVWRIEKALRIDRYDDKNFVSWLAYGKFMTLPEIYKKYQKDYRKNFVHHIILWVLYLENLNMFRCISQVAVQLVQDL